MLNRANSIRSNKAFYIFLQNWYLQAYKKTSLLTLRLLTKFLSLLAFFFSQVICTNRSFWLKQIIRTMLFLLNMIENFTVADTSIQNKYFLSYAKFFKVQRTNFVND